MLHFVDTLTMFGVTYPMGWGDDTTRYGDPVRTEGEGVVVPCQARPQGRGMEKEDLVMEDRRWGVYHVLVPPETVFDGLSRVEWHGVSYEVMGNPQPFRYRNGVHHIEFTMREIEGG